MLKTVLVTGDDLTLVNLLALDSSRVPWPDGAPGISVQTMPGGAARLKEVTEEALDKTKDTVQHFALSDENSRARKYLRWDLHQNDETDTDDKDKVWRIAEHLGVYRPASSSKKTAAPARKKRSGSTTSPDVILIEDQALGFRDNKDLWPEALRSTTKARIVLSTCSPICEGPLWKLLVDKHRDRLTVVMSVSALRHEGADIGLPLSWDRTVEDVVRHFDKDDRLALAMRSIVVFGMEGAASFTRQSLTSKGGPLAPKAQFERCLYDPRNLEDEWARTRPGSSPDGSSIVAAAMACHELDPANYPPFFALGRGLAAMRKSHLLGARSEQARLDLSVDHLKKIFNPRRGAKPAITFYTAFPHTLLKEGPLSKQLSTEQSLLHDFTGAGHASVLAKALDVVLRGTEKVLEPVPRAHFGRYFTVVDRDEIERIHAIKNLIKTYLHNEEDKRPLSLAVFGPPGSGKSYAVKELIKDLVVDGAKELEFNLSQLRQDNGELQDAFQLVRDATIKDQKPFVFWDEFDTDQLKWLKDFLVPMQDVKFQAGAHEHPFGKTVFVFAGGTSQSFEKFNKENDDNRNVKEDFRMKKGPDFVSRLRGYLNIKGPNPEPPHPKEDFVYLIRRALILRSNLEKHGPALFNARKEISADASLVQALLTVDGYVHGARSIESVVSMSNLSDAHFFGPSQLPSRDLLRLHLTPDFEKKIFDPSLDFYLLERLAQRLSKRRRATRKAAITRSPLTNKAGADLDNNPYKARVLSTVVGLFKLRFVLKRNTATGPSAPLAKETLEDLKKVEDERWRREELQSGYQWPTPKPRKTKLDNATVNNVLRELKSLGFQLVRPTK